jgi:2-hydroxy-6-oxonona-2,4-dienedioate hydrolase
MIIHRSMIQILKYIVIVMTALIVFLMLAPYAVPIPGKDLPAEFHPFPESRFLLVDGIRLHYRLFEPEDLPAKGNIMLVHGFSGSTFSWRHTLPFLRENGYRVIAVDLPAYGFSDKSSTFNHSSSSRAELLWKLAGEYSESGWILAGHSMGAATVLAMAGLHPQETDYLILVDGGFVPSSARQRKGVLTSLLHFPPLMRWAELIASQRFFHFSEFERLLGSAYGESPDSLAVAGYLRPFLYKGSARAVLNSFRHAEETFEIDLQGISSKTLIVWGEKDSWVPVASGTRIHRQLPDSRIFIIPESGHCPMETHPEEFNYFLLKFLVSD